MDIKNSLELAGIRSFNQSRYIEYIEGLNNVFSDKDETIEVILINNNNDPEKKEIYFFSRNHIIKLNEFTNDEYKWSFSIFKNDVADIKVNNSNLYLSKEGFHPSTSDSLSIEVTLKDSDKVLNLNANGAYCEVLWNILVKYLI